MRQYIIRARYLRKNDVVDLLGTTYKLTQVSLDNPMYVYVSFRAMVPFDDAPSVEVGHLYLQHNSAVQIRRKTDE